MKTLRVMIVSDPGTWQRVLQRNLEAYPFIEVIDVVSGGLSASQFVQKEKTDLMVIDSSIPLDDVVALVQNVKLENPEIRSLVITDTTQQRRRVIQSGADFTISSYNYEAQIGEILKQIKRIYSDDMAGSETITKTGPSLSDQVNSLKKRRL